MDFILLNDFPEKLDKEEMEECSRCQEKWFHMGLDSDRVCNSCQKVDKGLDDDLPFLYSRANEMDPGPISDELESLTQIEGMLIARVHCFVEVRQVRGVQYKYKGHVVNFLTNTPKVYNRLPLLPEDLDVIVIRPSNWNKDPRMRRQFRSDTRVRKPIVRAWLEHLHAHRPGYKDIEIAHNNLEALGDEFFAENELIIHEIEAEDVINAAAIAANEMDDDPEIGTVFDLHA